MKSLLIIVCCVVLQITIAMAQESSPKYSLSEALNYYQDQDSLFFSYDASLIDLFQVDFSYTELSFSKFRENLEIATPFKFNAVGDGFYTLQVTKAVFDIELSDDSDGKAIASEYVTILINGQPISSNKKKDRVTFDYKPQVGDSIVFFVLGYEPKTLSLQELLSKSSHLVEIHAKTIELSNLIIQDYLTQGINLNPVDQSINIAVVDLPLLPGETDGDLFASLAALPGVSTPDNRPGNLYIRGSSVDQSLIVYDDIPIYHKGHYYGMISPYNTRMVEEVQVYRSGFHPRMGGRVGGALEINSAQKVQEDLNVGLGANLLYYMGYFTVPLFKNKMGLSFSARKSFPNEFTSPKLSAISESVFAASAVIDQFGEFPDVFTVDFQDFSAKWVYQINSKNRLSASAFYTETDLYYEFQQTGEPEKNGFKNGGVNVKWSSLLGGRWSHTLSFTGSEYDFKFLANEAIVAYGEDLPGFYSLNDIKDLGVKEEIQFNGERINLQAGVDYAWQEVSFAYRDSTIRIRPRELYVLSDTVKSSTLAPFVNLELKSLKRFYLQIGLRAAYYTQTSDFRLSPRVSFNYEFSKEFILKGSAGMYNQYLSQVKNLEFTRGGFDNELWLLADSQGTKVVQGQQYSFGGLLNKRSWVLDIEGYWKTAKNVNYHSIRKLSPQGSFETGDHTMYGVDLFLKKQVSENSSLWAGYTYSQINVLFDSTDVPYPVKYSQPHELYVGGAFQKNNFKLSASYRYASGLYAKSIDVLETQQSYEETRQNRPPPEPRPGGPNGPPPNPFANLEERYPSIHVLDFSASYNLPKTDKRPVSMTLGLSISNVLNQENLTDRVVRVGPNSPPTFHDRLAMGFAPNIMLIVEW